MSQTTPPPPPSMEDLQHQLTTAQTDAIYWQQQAKQITQELNERMTQEVQSYLRSMETLRQENRQLAKALGILSHKFPLIAFDPVQPLAFVNAIAEELREAHEEIGHLKANNRYQRGYADGQKEPTAPTLRPITEAADTPIPDGCIRIYGAAFMGTWIMLQNTDDPSDTHFADLRLPAPEEGGAA